MELHFIPFKVQVVQELRQIVFPKQPAFAIHFHYLERTENIIFHKLVMSDEEHF